MTESELKEESVLLGESIYWVGPRDGYRSELWRDRRGLIFVRYLPDGVPARAPGTDFLIVATYPFPHAYAHLCWLQDHKNGNQALDGPGAGVYLVPRTHRQSVYVAVRDADYEFEMYDPHPAVAASIASSGRVRPVSG